MVDRKRIELFPKACKAPVLPLSLTAHLKILHQYIVFVKLKVKLDDHDLRIYEDFTIVPYFGQVQRHCAHRNHKLKSNVYLVNFSLLYLLMVACYNSIH